VERKGSVEIGKGFHEGSDVEVPCFGGVVGSASKGVGGVFWGFASRAFVVKLFLPMQEGDTDAEVL
jgi:hypothetical protein